MRLILVGMVITGATLALSATDGMAQCTAKSIPLPSRALLEPLPKISCEFTSSSLGEGGSQNPTSSSGQTTASPNGTLPMRLDYERQCYRHTEMILHEGLRRLQASVRETIKAINKACPSITRSTGAGAKLSIPLPNAALLSPPQEFVCDFKNNASNTSASQSQSDTNAELALGMKLDYERQCYRHAALIVYDTFQNLQSSVRETTKAISSSQALAKQTPQSKPKPSSVTRPSLASIPPPGSKQPSKEQAREPVKQQKSDLPAPSNIEQAPCAIFRDRCLGRDPDPRIRSMMTIESHGGS
jgi:hypothetical protein